MRAVTLRSAFCCLLLSLSSCATSPPPAPASAAGEPAPGLRVPFPEGFRVSDLRAILTGAAAPSAEALARCDFDYQVEKRIAGGGGGTDVSKEQLFHAFPAHVQGDPERYHWCFFRKILAIHESSGEKAGEKPAARRAIWDDFMFLTHVARVFQVDLGDARYLRWVIWTYQKVGKENFFPAVRPGSETEWQLNGLEPGASSEGTR